MKQLYQIEVEVLEQSSKYDLISFQLPNVDSCYLIIARKTGVVQAWEYQIDYAYQAWGNFKGYVAERVAIDMEIHCTKCNSYFHIYDDLHLSANIECTHCGEKLLVTDDVRETGIKIRALED